MRLRVGTSGFQYKFWRGGLYSERCRPSDMLAEYASKLATVEINSTFYRMPRRDVLLAWTQQVPEEFRFALKASRRITHLQRLKDVGDSVAYLLDLTQALGDRLACVLFQLPPTARCDLERLETFLAGLPQGARAALEFRHRSWFDEEVYRRLRDRNVALCISDQGEGESATPFVSTADWGYLRLRRESYGEDELGELARRMAEQSWSEAFAYFKHEQDAPELALRLQAMCPR